MGLQLGFASSQQRPDHKLGDFFYIKRNLQIRKNSGGKNNIFNARNGNVVLSCRKISSHRLKTEVVNLLEEDIVKGKYFEGKIPKNKTKKFKIDIWNIIKLKRWGKII